MKFLGTLKRSPALIPFIVWAVAATGSGLLVVASALASRSETPSQLVQVFQALVSLPVVLLTLALAFGIRFGAELSGVLGRLSKVWFAGGGFEAVQSPPEPAKPAEPGGGIDESASSRNTPPPTAPDQLLTQQRTRVYWYLAYLGLYLQPATQAVLSWLAQAGREVSWNEFESTWKPLVPADAERGAILDALQRHYLVEQNGPLLGITPWGKIFLAYRAGTWRPVRDYGGDNVPIT